MLEGNMAHALFYAPHEERQRYENMASEGHIVSTVPDRDDTFSYAIRCDILKGVADLHHAGAVLADHDGINWFLGIIDKIPRSGAFRPGRKPIPEIQAWGWID